MEQYKARTAENFCYINEADVLKEELQSSVPMHWHDFCELEFVVSGSGKHLYKNLDLPYEPGVLFVQLPVDFHEVIVDANDKPTIYNIKFSETYLDAEIYRMLFNHNTINQVHYTGEEYKSVLREVEELYTEYNSDNLFREHTLKIIIQKLIIRLLRDVLTPEKGYAVSAQKPNIFVDSLLYIHQNYHKEITLSELAQMANMSPNYFSTLFRRQIGCTFQKYIIDMRMRYAISFLSNYNVSVSEISALTGFKSYAHFERTFKKNIGVSPKNFRNAIQQQRSNNKSIPPENIDDVSRRLHKREDYHK